MNPAIFREYDIRGVVDEDLNIDFAYRLGQAIGTYSLSRGICNLTTGRDCRLSSESYHAAINQGLLATGINVIDIGLCATPMLYFSIRQFKADGGIMITGSHNPPEFNGFKICLGFDTIYGEEIQNLKRVITVGNYEKGKGRYLKQSISKEYADFLCNQFTLKEGINVVLDGGNGVGGYFAAPILRKLGCRVTEIFCEPDGHFPNHFPDPTVPENLSSLIANVKESNADIGLAYDGDADRLGIVANDGRILWGDELLLIFSRAILEKNPGAAIIGEVKCSQKLYDDIYAHGGKAIMWKAGHSLIKGKMKETNALLAGEMSGHLFFADRYFGYDDAIYASLRILEIMSETGKTVTDLIADVPVTFTTPEIRIDCPDDVKFRIVDQVRDHFKSMYPIIDIDGVRIPFNDGWGLIRCSNTQPVLVLRFEASTQSRLDAIRSTIEEIVYSKLRGC
ncbi:MAG: Phosphomannomutase/phosphoglucomutase [Syntrophus sp. PtaB.Bin001]|nr:MAG: Phosphomannomutase/phosphoglucomutase [Syntrophus sp. PtaB.Bin001]